MMTDNKAIQHILRSIISILTITALILTAAGADFCASYAACTDAPIREVHKVTVGSRQYCFFVTHNVVLTPEEVQALPDAELTKEILSRAGLYMKEMNCKSPSHKPISVESWLKSGGSFLLSDDDISSVRGADPVDGEPVKLYMDLKVSVKPPASDKDKDKDDADAGSGDEDSGEEPAPEVYSTYKKVSPRLIFVAVATESDAASGEDICEEDRKARRSAPSGGDDGEGEEMLPEYRTINMVDRSGKPLEDTLQDGTPVTLRWIDPKDISDDGEGSGFIDHIPGGAIGLAGIILAVLAAAAAVIASVRRQRQKE